MPYAVAQWPYSPDPRPPDFNQPGWDFGQVGPWRWRVQTEDATGIYVAFNDGVVFEAVDPSLPEDTLFLPLADLGNDLEGFLSIKGFEEPFGSPPFTKSFGIRFDVLGLTVFGGGFNLLYPKAIQVHGPFDMAEDNPSDGTIPEPMTITPVKWNAE